MQIIWFFIVQYTAFDIRMIISDKNNYDQYNQNMCILLIER